MVFSKLHIKETQVGNVVAKPDLHPSMRGRLVGNKEFEEAARRRVTAKEPRKDSTVEDIGRWRALLQNGTRTLNSKTN